MGVENLFTKTGATTEKKVKLANDLLLINHLKNIDDIDQIDDKCFKSITSTVGEKKR